MSGSAVMYATCLFCARPLGRNTVIEHFPVGRRLAFDARRGRLWVVCRACARWNLTPLEERWEAIEECERLFRATRLRVSTDHVGLARLPEGLELVRIGEPQRPEIAAWRYGDQFGRRRRQHLIGAGIVAAAGGLMVVGGLVAGAGAIILWQAGRFAVHVAEDGLSQRTVAHLRTDDGGLLRVRRMHLRATTFVESPDGLALSVAHDGGSTVVAGEDARRAAGRLLPAVNRFAGTPDDVRLAVERLVHAGSAEAFFASLARRGPRLTRVQAERRVWDVDDPTDPPPESGLHGLPTSLALAIEMAAHEEQERRALEGELAALEQAWRDAEEIGAIADDLLLPAPVARALARLRGRTAE